VPHNLEKNTEKFFRSDFAACISHLDDRQCVSVGNWHFNVKPIHGECCLTDLSFSLCLIGRNRNVTMDATFFWKSVLRSFYAFSILHFPRFVMQTNVK
jgi:hypothetical protein